MPADEVGGDLWVDKHVPKSREELVVHKDKVAAVATWLHSQSDIDYAHSTSPCLLITGPAGSGKSTTVQVLAHAAGFSITEWHPPLPTLWHEHCYQEGMDVPYVSKMDAFDSFVTHAKLNALQLAPTTNTGDAFSQSADVSMADYLTDPALSSQDPAAPSKALVLVDDLPHAQGTAQRKRLVQALGTLAATAQQPVIIILTETGSSGSSKDRNTGPASPAASQGGGANTAYSLHADIKAAVMQAGATHIQFNPLADTFAAKALVAMAEREGLPLSKEAAKHLAVQSAGDLFHAIETLQLACVGRERVAPASRKRARGKSTKKAAQLPQISATDILGGNARDVALSMFRALGKILYNKRVAPSVGIDVASKPTAAVNGSPAESIEGGVAAEASLRALLGRVDSSHRIVIADRLKRHAPENSAEDVMLHSGLDVAQAAAFLHENMLHFFSDDHVDEAAAALDYLVDADRILSGQSASSSSPWDADDHPSSSFAEAAAGSLLARGLAFANGHPAPRTWYQMRGPAWRAANRAARANCDVLSAFAWQHGAGGSAPAWAAGTLPYLRSMASWGYPAASGRLPPRWWRLWNGQLHEEQHHHAEPAQGGQQQARPAAGLQEESLEEELIEEE